MTSSTAPIPVDQLLAHHEWVRRVARAMVRDENDADDLEQSMWLAALQRPPRSGRSIRGWIYTALRHDWTDFGRSEASRARREESRARTEAVPATADLVAEADVHKRVVVAVMDLAEPYRATVLHRFFEDTPPSVIARRQGVPLETVRTRLRRALALLRQRFDKEGHGDAASCRLALLPLLNSPGPAVVPAGAGAAAAIGGIVMKTSTQVLVVATLLAACGLTWWAVSSGAPTPVEVANEDPPAQVPPTPRTPRAKRAKSPAPAPTPDVTPTPAPEPTPTPAAPAIEQADPPAAPAPPAKPPAPIGELAGRVLLIGDRSPVEGAVVSLRGSSAAENGVGAVEIPALTTGARGEFRFLDVPAGTYKLRASKEGFSERTMSGVELTDTDGVAGLEVLLATGGGIEGVVTDAQGAPVNGVSVMTYWGGPPSGSAATKTGEDGTFRFEHVPPGRHRVVATRGEESRQGAFVSVVDGETARADFGAAAALTGVLLDEAGAAVPGALVRVSRVIAGQYTTRNGKTDESGRFRVEALERGEWNVFVQAVGAAGFAADIANVTVEWGDQDVTLRLSTGALAGRVYLKATGQALAGGAVQLSLYALVDRGGTWGLGKVAAFAHANADGTFRFRGLAPGRFRLIAHPRDKTLRSFKQDFDIASTTVGGVEVALEAGRTGTVRIVVKDPDGKPVEGATVLIDNTDGTTVNVHPTVEAPGTYVVVLEARPTVISLYRADLRSKDATVDIVEGETTNLDLVLGWGTGDPKSRAASGEIAGRIYIQGTSKPLSKNEIRLSLYAVKPWKHAGVALAGDDGKFRFRGLAPGSYRIMAHPVKPVYRQAQVDVELAASGNAEGIELAFEECTCGTVKFVVEDASGKPVEGVRFSTMKANVGGGSTSSTLHAKSSEPGVYLAETETGSRTINVYLKGFESKVEKVRVKDGKTVEVKVVLRPKR